MTGDDERVETIVVNLFGGPGTGKSTMAAGIFSTLKWNWVNCELVTEYAKEKVWEESHQIFENQMYVLAKQLQRIKRLEGKVDVIVTDSPIILPILYNTTLSNNFDNLIMEIFKPYSNMNYLLLRKKKYFKKGRTQSYEEAVKLDKETKYLLDSHRIPYQTLVAEPASQKIIVKRILDNLGMEPKYPL